jgi:hypothetical protein
MQKPVAIAFDGAGNLYVADGDNYRIREINTSGIIKTIAGNGAPGYIGENIPATDANVWPLSIAADNLGNVYMSDMKRIRKINAAGIITTIAGDTTWGYNGDGIPATAARVYSPYLGFIDDSGAVYFADSYNHRIRKINAVGIISTIYGMGFSGSSGDGGPATAAYFVNPDGVARNARGELFIPDGSARRIRKIDTAGIITAFAGTGGGGITGDGGPATIATVGGSTNVVIDDSGNVYICASSAHKVRKVDAAGMIDRVVGTGVPGYGGDDGPAMLAQLYNPSQVAMYHGNLYIADRDNNRIRKVTYNTDTTAAPTSVANIAANNVAVYPNPANDDITIDAAKTIEKAIVLDVAGRVVASYSTTAAQAGKKISISTAGIPGGMYMVKVNGVFAGKFLKQ